MSRHKFTIPKPGEMLPGSVTTAFAQCGKKNCACKTDPDYLHGPYYRWTGKIRGKHTTRTLSPKIAKECSQRIKNYKKFLKAIQSLLDRELDNAPWCNKNSQLLKNTRNS